MKVPGFEPLSEQTTNNLSIALQGANAYIDLNKALELVPGSRIIIPYTGGPTAGSFGHDKWFEIPSGPPPNGSQCPNNYVRDIYKILRDNARVPTSSTDDLEVDCGEYSNFNLNSCSDEFSEGLR